MHTDRAGRDGTVCEITGVDQSADQVGSDGGTRPIVFRLNLEWRVLIDRAEVARYRRAEWNTLVAR